MKTFTDMIERVRMLQNETDVLLRDLEQAQDDASGQKDKGDQNTSEIVPIMMKAKHSAIKEHCIVAQEPPVQEAYVVLLLALAKQQAQLVSTNETFMYPCRIAAACPSIPDIEEMYAKALTENEGIMDEYLTVVQDKSLQYSLIFDAMVMSLLYDKGREQMLELVADMASLLAITENQMQELIFFVKGYMAQDEIVCKAFTYLPADIVEQCLLRYCKKYVIAVHEQAIFHWESEEDHLSTIIDTVYTLLEKKREIPCNYYDTRQASWDTVQFSRIGIGGYYWVRNFSSCFNVLFPENKISKIKFSKMFFTTNDSLFFSLEEIHEVLFEYSKFINCQTRCRDSYYSDWHACTGILRVSNCINITFDNCWFDNNRIGGPNGNFDRTALKLVDGSYQNLVVKECKAPDGDVTDNTIPLK